MTARPDVPDTPDRTDAIARVLMVCEQAHDEADSGAWPEMDDYARWLLTTDDPAAVAALAATLAERHPEALLDALVKARVLTDEVVRWCSHGQRIDSSHHICSETGRRHSRVVTGWREVTND